MDQVFLQIFNTAITAGWLVLAVILARLLLKKAPAWIKCALWAIVAVRLVWPFSFESVLSLLPSAQTIPPSQLYVPAPQVHTGISSLNAAINPVFTETFRAEPMNSVNPLQVSMWVAGYVWILGMIAMSIYAVISYLRIHRRVRVCVPEGDGVYLCDQIPAPFILGIINPRIYLPANLPREKWDCILAHERSHLARRDHWWKPLGFLLLTVFWFHPLLWVAYILLCRDVELACDERVIKSLSAEEKQDYSNTLLECSIPGRWIAACPLAFGETGVKQRIKAVLHYKKPTLWILIIALIACTVLAVCFLTDPFRYGKIPTSRPLGVYVREIEEARFIGTDESGNRWEIEAVAEEHWLGQVVWVTLDGEPQVLQAPTQDTPGSYKVKPARVWNMKDCDLIDYGVAHDVGSFDIDHDGILEQCVLSFGPTSGMLTFELSVWSGKTREASVIFYSNTSKNAAALYAEDGALKILTPDQAYQEENWHMHIYDVSFDNGTLIVSENGEPLDILEVAGKTYIYEKEGFGGDFTISIFKDGTFQYDIGPLSSYIGRGTWELKNNKLYLYHNAPNRSELFVFNMKQDSLSFIADESDDLRYATHKVADIPVLDGDQFHCQADTPMSDVSQVLPGPAEIWKHIYQVIGLETGEFQLRAFPEHTFRWGDGKIEIIRNGKATSLIENATICNIGAVDLNLDGYAELCATVYTEKEGEYVMIYDIANGETYTLQDPDGAYAYYLYTEYSNGYYYVMCAKDDLKTGKAIDAGSLIFIDGKTPAIKETSLHTLSSDTVTVVFDRNHPDSAHQGEVKLDGFPGASVRWYFTPNAILNERPVIVKNGEEKVLFENYRTPMSLYIADVTGDGKPDLCADVYYFFSGLPSFNAVCVYDYANDRYYILADYENLNHSGKLSYYLRLEDGKLVCDKITVDGNSVLATGSLYLSDDGENTTLRMKTIRTYDSPVDYTYIGEQGLDRVTLTVVHEGTCDLFFSHKPEGGLYQLGTLRGSYSIQGDLLYFHTEDRAVYVFRFEGEDLVFVAEKSSELPENCILYDGAVLKANRRYE